MIAPYCALIFGIVTYWDADPIIWSSKDDVKHALLVSDQMTYVSLENGHESTAWGASMKKCEPANTEEQLKIIGYLIDFDGDGKVCR